ncbi:hypothetical protein EWM64_g2776 [Hericium alpestre]|uniref:Uncharacterized protein n=1 Tax=Hericium alpestre TaxID=135208 RepID=A0A4Z0A478_9AGAM|nr:hypothetical protein EWM64_g2776 [Hericium alpestre]
MSNPANSLTLNGVALGQSNNRYVVPPQAIQSAISTHQSARINKASRGIKSLEFQVQYEAAAAAYFSGQISTAEFNAAQKRAMDAGREYDRCFTDYLARTQAGQTEPGDFWKEFDGCTNEEAEEPSLELYGRAGTGGTTDLTDLATVWIAESAL